MLTFSNNHGFNKSETIKPIVWSIASLDGVGGVGSAGIQADSLTIQDLGGHACKVVTATTTQNSEITTDIAPTPSKLMLNQLNCFLSDLMPSAIKIGLLTNTEQFQLVCQWLETVLADYQQKHKLNIPIIWDLVMVSSSGHSLAFVNNQPTVHDYLCLAQQVTLITCNECELKQLADMFTSDDVSSQSALDYAADALSANILVTVGDSDDECTTDWLAARSIAHTSAYHEHQRIGFKSSRVNTSHNQSSRCTLSSAIATTMALGHPLLDAIVIAKAYVQQGLLNAHGLDKGPDVLARKGWPNDLLYFPEILLPKYPHVSMMTLLKFAAITEPLQVYTVTQSLHVLEQVLKAGARTVQLRVKLDINSDADSVIQDQDQVQCHLDKIENDIICAIALGRQYKAQVFINDHWQLALKHSAFGVHLGQEDLLQADLSQIAEAGLALGLSSHGYFEMLLVQQLSPSYLAIGHIFPTPTKQMPSLPQGLLKLSRYCQLLSGKVPLVAIGGVTIQNLSQLKSTLVNDVAVVRGIELAENPGRSWQAFQQKWQALS
jgi:hydroxymethylpyrimidine kinase/phosphomethylpyrimidine kinase/thiamine-phosphate diphosphorylase